MGHFTRVATRSWCLDFLDFVLIFWKWSWCLDIVLIYGHFSEKSWFFAHLSSIFIVISFLQLSVLLSMRIRNESECRTFLAYIPPLFITLYSLYIHCSFVLWVRKDLLKFLQREALLYILGKIKYGGWPLTVFLICLPACLCLISFCYLLGMNTSGIYGYISQWSRLSGIVFHMPCIMFRMQYFVWNIMFNFHNCKFYSNSNQAHFLWKQKKFP